jgi:hypothetical protein
VSPGPASTPPGGPAVSASDAIGQLS